MKEKINWKLEIGRFFIVALVGYAIGILLGLQSAMKVSGLWNFAGTMAVVIACYAGILLEKYKVK